MKYVLASILILSACTDAEKGKISALGSAASVTCYSGAQVIYSGRSTGKVLSEGGSDGYFFRDSVSRHTMEVSGQCVVKYDH